MKLLIISEAIAPTSTIASIRWTKIGKYLNKESGVEVDILTTKKRYSKIPQAGSYLLDSTLEKDLIFFNKVWEIPEGFRAKVINWSFSKVGGILKRTSNNLVSNKVEKTANSNDSKKNDSLIKRIYFSTYGLLLRIKGRSICHQAKKLNINWNEYDVIVSSFSPRWVHLLGKWVKKNHPDIIWVADYRDSALSIYDVSKREKKQFAQIYTSLADFVIGVSQGVLDNLRLSDHQYSRVITNGFDPEDLSERSRKKKKKFIVSYTGTLYDEGECKSDIRPFFAALEELMEEKEIDPNKILVVYAGGNSNIFCNQIERYKTSIDNLDVGFISRAESYELQESSSILLLCTWNTKAIQGVITGKIFEYFSSGVPIVGLCTGDLNNSAVKEMLEESRAGFCYEEVNKEVDFNKLKEFIKNQYRIWEMQGFSNCDVNKEYILSFGYNRIANDVYQLIVSQKKDGAKVK